MLAVLIPVGVVLLAVFARGASGSPAHGGATPVDRGVPFAGGGQPIWPLHPDSQHPQRYTVSYKGADDRWYGRASRAFMASRDSRYHAGVDLFANAGDLVVAPEDGVVVGRQPFLNGTGAMLVALDSGPVVLLGETKMGGADEFDVDVGTRVQRGQPLTRVGLTNAGSHMLHLETYAAGTTHNFPWYKSRPRPPQLLDPSEWLLTARANTARLLDDAAVA
jgi:murein DD-endopeptidase MepM/ murein hydrolase activator NlpD